MKKICLTLLIIILISLPALAWEYNFSKFDAAIDDPEASCIEGKTYGSWEVRQAIECTDGSAGTVSERKVTETKVMRSNACYQYSCYYQALSFTETAEMEVQPLTEDPQYAIDAIESLTEDKLDKKTGILGKRARKEQGKFSADMWDAGAGTSSMEGLLWSWRMVSNNWKGVWSERSAYEHGNVQAKKRNNLPDEEHQKHIVIVSDGGDTDGVLNSRDSSVNAISKDGALGFLISEDAKKVPFDVCDAHQDLQSLTLDDYTEVCEAIAEQNIKVHTLLYGFEGDENTNPLIKCSKITGGQVYNDVAPEELEASLKQIFVEFAVARVRLAN